MNGQNVRIRIARTFAGENVQQYYSRNIIHSPAAHPKMTAPLSSGPHCEQQPPTPKLWRKTHTVNNSPSPQKGPSPSSHRLCVNISNPHPSSGQNAQCQQQPLTPKRSLFPSSRTLLHQPPIPKRPLPKLRRSTHAAKTRYPHQNARSFSSRIIHNSRPLQYALLPKSSRATRTLSTTAPHPKMTAKAFNQAKTMQTFQQQPKRQHPLPNHHSEPKNARAVYSSSNPTTGQEDFIHDQTTCITNTYGSGPVPPF